MDQYKMTAPTVKAGVKRYFVVRHYDLASLQGFVEELLQKGWSLQGGISTTTVMADKNRDGKNEPATEYSQAMYYFVDRRQD